MKISVYLFLHNCDILRVFKRYPKAFCFCQLLRFWLHVLFFYNYLSPLCCGCCQILGSQGIDFIFPSVFFLVFPLIWRSCNHCVCSVDKLQVNGPKWGVVGKLVKLSMGWAGHMVRVHVYPLGTSVCLLAISLFCGKKTIFKRYSKTFPHCHFAESNFLSCQVSWLCKTSAQ